MKCFKCGNALPDDSKFCQYCGADLTQGHYCGRCGAVMQEEMNFCPKCGQRTHGEEDVVVLAPEVEPAPVFSSSIVEEKDERVPVAVIDTPEESCTPPEQPQEKKKKSRLPLILLGIAMILVGGFFAINGGKKGTSPAEVAKNVLYLEVYDRDDVCIGSGSGFLINDEVTLVTNYHVIDGAYRMIAMTADGEHSVAVDTLLAYDETVDLAILKCNEKPGVSPLVLSNSDKVEKGDKIYAVGYPLGISNTISDGIVSSRYIDEYGVDMIQITAPVSGGSSGGALLNEAGCVIGVVSACYTDGQNMNLAIPISYVVDLQRDKTDAEQSVKEFYSAQHPYIEFDEYYAGVRVISIMPEIYDSTASWEKAKLFAETIYNEWLLGEATEDTIIEIFDDYGEAQGGGKLYAILPGEFVQEINDWCFDRTRQRGDTAIIKNPYGYSIVYFSGAVVKTSSPNAASDYVQWKAALQGLEADRKYGPGVYGGAQWLNEQMGK